MRMPIISLEGDSADSIEMVRQAIFAKYPNAYYVPCFVHRDAPNLFLNSGAATSVVKEQVAKARTSIQERILEASQNNQMVVMAKGVLPLLSWLGGRPGVFGQAPAVNLVFIVPNFTPRSEVSPGVADAMRIRRQAALSFYTEKGANSFGSIHESQAKFIDGGHAGTIQFLISMKPWPASPEASIASALADIEHWITEFDKTCRENSADVTALIAATRAHPAVGELMSEEKFDELVGKAISIYPEPDGDTGPTSTESVIYDTGIPDQQETTASKIEQCKAILAEAAEKTSTVTTGAEMRELIKDVSDKLLIIVPPPGKDLLAALKAYPDSGPFTDKE